MYMFTFINSELKVTTVTVEVLFFFLMTVSNLFLFRNRISSLSSEITQKIKSIKCHFSNHNVFYFFLNKRCVENASWWRQKKKAKGNLGNMGEKIKSLK